MVQKLRTVISLHIHANKVIHMKLLEIKKPPAGTYAAGRFTDKSVAAIRSYVDNCKIPNPLSPLDYHVTILYSKKHLPDYKAAGVYDEPIQATPRKVKIWENKDGKNVLVLTLDSPALTRRHKKLMDEHDASYDFATYKPHVTLSYDVGDFDIKNLPEFEDELEIHKEYSNDLKD